MNSQFNYTDSELVNLLKKDDERAFTVLYNRYWKKLYAIALNRLKNINSAEDIVHDVFVSLWSNRKDTSIIEIEHYLAVAVKYAVLNRIKKDINEREKRKSFSKEASVIEFLPADSNLDNKRLLERIWQEVESLPERCRIVFLYSRQAGLPVKEIAKRLSISPKTVENHLGKALRQVKLAARSFLQSFL